MNLDHAFDAFVRDNATSLLRTAYLLTGEHGAAEDLLQDTLTYLYPRWERVAEADLPTAYVRRSLTNRFLSSRRSAGRNPLRSMWSLPDRADERDVGEEIASQDIIWRLLATLSERQRAAVVLRHYHDLPDDQIAATLGCRPATVRSLISRAITSMRADALAGVAANRSEGN